MQLLISLTQSGGSVTLSTRQGLSLLALHLFKRLLVLRNPQARSSRTKSLIFSISSTPLELSPVQHSPQLALYISVDLSPCRFASRHDHSTKPTLTGSKSIRLQSPLLFLPAPAYVGHSNLPSKDSRSAFAWPLLEISRATRGERSCEEKATPIPPKRIPLEC